MQLANLKTFVRSILTESEIRAFGLDLRQRESWEVLADRCKEYAAAAQDMAQESAEVVQEIATPIAQKLWDAATSETAQRIYRGVLMAIVLMVAVVVLGLKAAAQHCWQQHGHSAALKMRDRLRVALGQLPLKLLAGLYRFRFRAALLGGYIKSKHSKCVSGWRSTRHLSS